MLLDFSTFHGCSLLLTDAQHFRYYNYITQRVSTSINFTLHFHYFTDTWTHWTPKSLFLFISFCKIHVFYNAYIFSVNFRENAFFSVRSVQRLETKGFMECIRTHQLDTTDTLTAKFLFSYIFILKIHTFSIMCIFSF